MDVPLVDGLLFALGIAVWIGLAVQARRAPHTLRLTALPPEPRHALRWPHLFWVASVYLLAAMLASRAAGPLPQNPASADPAAGARFALQAVSAPLAGAIATVSVILLTWSGGLRDWGLKLVRPGRALLWALAAFVAILPVVFGAAEACEWLARRLGRGSWIHDHEAIQVLRDPALAPWARYGIVLSAALLAPLGEELFWRGLVQPWATQTLHSRARGILVASALFGLVHFPQPIAVLPLTLMALVLGYTYERTGSLWTPILIHMLFNIRTLILSAPQWLPADSAAPAVVGA